jgi:6,7-dimethyl-8-ribityllumazine synthase
MADVIQGTLDAKSKKWAIVVARFNEMITSKLVEGAKDCLLRHGANEGDITVIWVPGVFEVPQVAKALVDSQKYSGVIALGTVIRGDTPHFDYVAGTSANGIANLSLSSSIPVIYGILTTENVEQAMDRAGVKAGNKGWDAALTAIDVSSVLEQI